MYLLFLSRSFFEKYTANLNIQHLHLEDISYYLIVGLFMIELFKQHVSAK